MTLELLVLILAIFTTIYLVMSLTNDNENIPKPARRRIIITFSTCLIVAIIALLIH